MAHTLFITILVLLSIDFVLERTLSFLNIRASRQPVPGLLAGIYDDEKYKKQQDYLFANNRFGLLSSSVNFILVLAAFAFGLFGWLDGLAGGWVENRMLTSLVFFGILFLASDLIATPFDIYATFVIEERFGFNKTTPKIYLLDKLKGYALTLIIGGGILSLVIWIYMQSPHYFWVIGWASVSVFSLFMSLFYSELIVPLFNKQTPLEEGELRSAIEKFAVKTGFNLKNIFVIDGSKRSTKANAYFTGWGKKKRIVLYDTLIEELNIDEIVAVLAHEIGHNKYKHTLKNLAFTQPYLLFIFFLLGLFLKNDVPAQALGGEAASFHLNALAFGILYSPISLILGILMNQISRKFEYEADHFVKTNGLGAELIEALKKISSQALSNLTPHPLYVFFNYSHPTLYQRVKALTETSD